MNESSWLQAIEFIDKWLTVQVEQTGLPGLVVGITLPDGTIFKRGYGFADITNRLPMTPDSLFCVASQSKMMTAVILMRLSEQGILTLDDLLVRHLPWLLEHSETSFRRITIRQLLWHGTGLIRDGEHSDFWQLRAPFPSSSDVRKMVLDSRLIESSVERVKYSDLGYALLGQVIESVAKSTYAQIAEREIVRPLGLLYSMIDYDPTRSVPLATGYTRIIRGRRYVIPKQIPTGGFAAAVGWHMTVEDSLRFVAAQRPGNNVLLSDYAKQQMHKGQRNHWKPLEDRGTDFGLGFMKEDLPKGHRLFGHSGSFVGHKSCSYFDTSSGMGLAIMSNAKDAPVMQILRGLVSVLDFYAENADKPPAKMVKRFSTTMANMWSTLAVVSVHSRIVIARLDDWLPFNNLEELEYIDSSTLRIKKSQDLSSPGELLRYTFAKNSDVVKVNYAGMTYLPEEDNYGWVTSHLAPA